MTKKEAINYYKKDEIFKIYFNKNISSDEIKNEIIKVTKYFIYFENFFSFDKCYYTEDEESDVKDIVNEFLEMVPLFTISNYSECKSKRFIYKSYYFYKLFKDICNYFIFNEINVNELIKEIKTSKYNENIFYRGQKDASWSLICSLVRGLKSSELSKDKIGESCKIGDNTNITCLRMRDIEDLYKENNNMFSPFRKYFDNFDDNQKNSYDFLAFMQHSIQYSPLIDLTADIKVALTFALQTNDPTTYMFKDSSLFKFECKTNQDKICPLDSHRMIIDDFKSRVLECIFTHNTPCENEFTKFNGTEIYIIDTKLSIGSKTKIVFGGDSRELNCYTNFKKFLDTEYYFLNIPTNDRMRIQKGKFLFLNKYLVVNGEVFVSNFSKDFTITKSIIPKDIKNKILKNLRKIKDLRQCNLMNPYSIFEE